MSLEISLARLKIAKINEFKGRKLLDLRNYYEKEGEIKPTQKGISLTAEQWKALLDHRDEISSALGVAIDDDSEEENVSKKRRKVENKKPHASNKSQPVKEEATDPGPPGPPVPQQPPASSRASKRNTTPLSDLFVSQDDMANDVQ